MQLPIHIWELIIARVIYTNSESYRNIYHAFRGHPDEIPILRALLLHVPLVAAQILVDDAVSKGQLDIGARFIDEAFCKKIRDVLEFGPYNISREATMVTDSVSHRWLVATTVTDSVSHRRLEAAMHLLKLLLTN